MAFDMIKENIDNTNNPRVDTPSFDNEVPEDNDEKQLELIERMYTMLEELSKKFDKIEVA